MDVWLGTIYLRHIFELALGVEVAVLFKALGTFESDHKEVLAEFVLNFGRLSPKMKIGGCLAWKAYLEYI